jgi:hypothetical protein
LLTLMLVPGCSCGTFPCCVHSCEQHKPTVYATLVLLEVLVAGGAGGFQADDAQVIVKGVCAECLASVPRRARDTTMRIRVA